MKDLFAGRHFDRDVIILCVRRYVCYKLSLGDLVEMMGERGLYIRIRRSCDGCSVMRQSSRSAGLALRVKWAVRGAWTMGVSLSCRRPGWRYRRLPTKSNQGRRGGQGVFPQGASYPQMRTGQYHFGWLRCIAPSSSGDAKGRPGMEEHQVEIVEVPEQSDRAGSPRY